MTTTPTMNPIAGAGTYSHHVPAVIGQVVEIRDGNHNGTSVWRGADDRLPFCFANHDKGDLAYAERCLLVRNLDVDAIPGDHPYGCDLSTPEGLVLLGVDRDENPSDLDWFEGEILWDSALEAEYEAQVVLDGGAFGSPTEIVRLVKRAKPTYLPQVGDSVVAERAFTDDEAVGIGWAAHMQRFVGKTGTVERVDGHGDAFVEFGDPGDGYKSWWWYKGALRLASKGGE